MDTIKLKLVMIERDREAEYSKRVLDAGCYDLKYSCGTVYLHSTPKATSDCKELNLNLVITGEGAYVLDCINGVEYQVETLEDYSKVVNAIRVLQERER